MSLDHLRANVPCSFQPCREECFHAPRVSFSHRPHRPPSSSPRGCEQARQHHEARALPGRPSTDGRTPPERADHLCATRVEQGVYRDAKSRSPSRDMRSCTKRIRLPGDSSMNTGMEWAGNVKARATTSFLHTSRGRRRKPECVGDDGVRGAQRRGEQGGQVEVALAGGAYDAGEDLLGVGASVGGSGAGRSLRQPAGLLRYSPDDGSLLSRSGCRRRER